MNLSKGSKNLLLLGIGATLIAGATTAISIAIYHYSGDIYLDRSRPGFLPEEGEEKDDSRQNTKYTFPDTGPIDAAALDEYLKEIGPYLDTINQLSDPFSPDPLSDATLAIPE